MKIKIPLLLLASIAALPPLAVDMYLPAIPAIARDLDTQISIVQNSLSIYLLGFGVGLLIFGPFSDRYGRKPLALLGLFGFALTSYLVSISTTAQTFLLFRLLQGLIGSAASVAVPAIIRDCYGKDTAKGLSNVTMIMLLAPLIAPLLGSFLLTLGEWEIHFQALTLYGVVVLLLTLWLLPETNPALQTQNENVDINDPVPKTTKASSIFSNYKIILGKRSIYLDLLCFMLSALTFFTYLTSVSFIYITYFKVSETLFGILFASTASSLIAANYINIRLVSRVGPRKMMQCALFIGTLFAGGLILVTLLQLPVYWTLACFIFIIGSLGVSSINADSLVLIQFPNQASSASAVTGTLRFGFGALAGPILIFIDTGTPLPISIMIFATLSCAGIAQIIRARYSNKDAT